MFSQKNIDISAGSILMAVGIFLLGAIHQFPYLYNWVDILSTILVISWVFMIGWLIKSLSNKNYLKSLLDTPIKSFGAGTWIAGTSVVGIIIINYFTPQPVLIVLLLVNTTIWFIFIIFCMWQLKKIVSQGRIKEVHGVILLTTVSTQSIACFFINYLGHSINKTLINILITVGIAFYLFAFILIIVRFFSKWRNIIEWKNTDCIIHGALSITGLSMTISGNFHLSVLIHFWYIVFCLFVIVEVFEIIRGIKRIKLFGWSKGVFTYDISQWSRNFTFGMFYFFSYNVIHLSSHKLQFQSNILFMLGWVVLVLLLVELFLMLKSHVSKHFIFLK